MPTALAALAVEGRTVFGGVEVILDIGRRMRGPDGAEGEARGGADRGDGDRGLFLPPGVSWPL
jgi:hypothetical protein